MNDIRMAALLLQYNMHYKIERLRNQSGFSYKTPRQQLGDMGEVPTVDLASTSWQQLGGMGEVSYGKYR